MEEIINFWEKQEHNLTAVFEEIFSGHQINKVVGDWRVSNMNSLSDISLMYQEGKAIYAFSFYNEDTGISMTNYHREAQKGLGSITLQEIETALLEYCKKKGKKINVSFIVYNQDDTEAWLQKNDYHKQQSDELAFFTKEL